MQIPTSFFETITQEILLRLRETKFGIVEVEEEGNVDDRSKRGVETGRILRQVISRWQLYR